MISVESFYEPSVYWFLIGLFLIVLELGLPGMIIIFFGAGAWVTSLCCLFFDIGLEWELAIFSVSSVLFLWILRSRLKESFFKDAELPEDFQADEFVGQYASVLQDISPDKRGAVQFRGTSWQATSDEHIEAGKDVIITEKNNITLTVTTKKS